MAAETRPAGTAGPARTRANSSYTAGSSFNLQVPLPPMKNLPPHLQALQYSGSPAPAATDGRGTASTSRGQLSVNGSRGPPPPPPRESGPVAPSAAKANSAPVHPSSAAGVKLPASGMAKPTATTRDRSESSDFTNGRPPAAQTRKGGANVYATTRGARSPSSAALPPPPSVASTARPSSMFSPSPIASVPPPPNPRPPSSSTIPKNVVAPPPRDMPAPLPRENSAPAAAPARKPPATAATVRSTVATPAPRSLPSPAVAAPPQAAPPVTRAAPAPAPASASSPPVPRAALPAPPPAASASSLASPRVPQRPSSPGRAPPVPPPPVASSSGDMKRAPPPPSRGGRPTLRYKIPLAPKLEPAGHAHSIFTPDLSGAAVNEVYVLGETLGSGGFAEVVLGMHKKTQKKVAVKVIDKEITAEADKEALMMELRILKSVTHPNVIQFLEFFDSPQKAYVVLELMQGGELLYQIEGEQEKSNYTENDARHIMRQILEAVGYLHQNKIVHRDLKPENLLFTEKGPNAKLKLIDFGLAKYYGNEPLTDWCGTPEYQAPEMIKRTGYDYKADVWSVGIILFVILSGAPPFRDNNKMRLYSKIVACKYEFQPEKFQGISDEAKDLVRQLLQPDPAQRFDCRQALQHPWLQATGSAASPIQAGNDLKKYNVSRRFQNTGKQLMNCQRFVAYSKEDGTRPASID